MIPPTKSDERLFLATASQNDIAQAFKASGEPAFRANQAYDWIVKKWTVNPLDMTNLSQKAKQILSDSFLCDTVKIETKHPADDGSAKFLLNLRDNEKIECAMIPAEDGRITFCLSSQVGCPVSCAFCSSGENGLVRNLQAGEIIEQYFLLCRDIGRAPDNVVMMGIGEPLLNFDNLVAALEVITNPDGVALAQRRVTISTSGWTPGIRQLTALRKQWNLAVSLHAPDDKTRALLIATKFRRDIRDILTACREHREATGRLLTIEYVLLAGINDSAEQAKKFAKLAADAQAKVNLIPYNKARGAFERPSREVIKRFENALKTLHVPVTVRVEKGSSATAACGQLRSSAQRAAKKLSIFVAILFLAALGMLSSCSVFHSEPAPLTGEQLTLFNEANSLDSDLTSLKVILNHTSPDFREPKFGRTPLMHAILNSDINRTKLLISASDNLSIADDEGNTAIHYAAAHPDPIFLKEFISAKANVNEKGAFKKTPIMEAARNGFFQHVKMLAEAGAKLDLTCTRGRTPAMYAAMAPYRSLDILTYLYEKGAPVVTFSNKLESPLLLAIDYHNTTTALTMIEALEESFHKNNKIAFTEVEYTVFNRYDTQTIIGLLAMKHAIAANDMKVINALIEHELPLNASINRIYRGMRLVNTEGFYELLARNYIIPDEKTPLFWAAEHNNVPIIARLIEAGADPLQRDATGNTPLQYALSRDAVSYLQDAEELRKKQIREEVESNKRKQYLARRASRQSSSDSDDSKPPQAINETETFEFINSIN